MDLFKNMKRYKNLNQKIFATQYGNLSSQVIQDKMTLNKDLRMI